MSDWYATDANGGEFASKRALREFIAQYPDDVRLTDTSAFENRGVVWGVSNLEDRDVIVGPNPWNARRWYACPDGKGNVR